MDIIIIDGGPRSNHNTGTLLKEAIRGAIFKGATVETINLYKLNYKGCISCMSCKRKGSPTLHSCALRDDLSEVLDKIKSCDGIIFASPIYFSDITGELRSFLERLLYPYLPYDISVEEGTYFPRAIKTGFIYTMGVNDETMRDKMKPIEDFISAIFRRPIETLYSFFNYPFIDMYTNYDCSDLSKLLKHRENSFAQECERAYQFGVDFVTKD